jgi:hypothetical protein
VTKHKVAVTTVTRDIPQIGPEEPEEDVSAIGSSDDEIEFVNTFNVLRETVASAPPTRKKAKKNDVGVPRMVSILCSLLTAGRKINDL